MIIDNNTKSSGEISGAGEQADKIQLMNEGDEFEGEFRIQGKTDVNNVAGSYYKILGGGDLQCDSSCELAENLTTKDFRCMECKDDKVLDQESGKCINACAEGFKNVADRCFKCKDENCEELEQDIFEAKPLEGTNFEINQLRDVEGLSEPLSENFDIKIDGKEPGDAYTLNAEDIPDDKKVKYTVDFPEGYDNEAPEVDITLKNQENLIDDNKNVLRN